MNNGFFIVTGTSTGIGEALAQRLLERGHTVLGIARSHSEELTSPNYHHLAFDLTDTSGFGRIIDEAKRVMGDHAFDVVMLVNNASALEPIGVIEKCAAEAIDIHIRIGLIAPMILSSLFIAAFADGTFRKKIAYMSSGAAHRPLPGESVYCSAKAGMLMLARCVGEEQQDRPNGFEIMSVGPGMVETNMQKLMRGKTNEEFGLVDMFKDAYEQGIVVAPEAAVEKIYTLLENRYEQGQYVSVTEV